MIKVLQGSIPCREVTRKTQKKKKKKKVGAALFRFSWTNLVSRQTVSAEEVRAALDSGDTRVDTRVEAKVDTRVEARLDTRLDTRVDTRVEARVDTRVEARVDTCLMVTAGLGQEGRERLRRLRETEAEAQWIREAQEENNSAKERELERKVVDLNARLAAKAEAVRGSGAELEEELEGLGERRRWEE
jgi:hypothetical protein